MRVASLVLVLLLCGGFVQAVTLEVWLTGHNNEEIRIISDITETHFTARTGIAVEYSTLSWGDFEARFLLAAASGEVPDLGGMGGLFAPELGVRGAVVDLAQAFGEEYFQVMRQVDPGLMRALAYHSHYYALPFHKVIIRHYWRTDLLEELGLQPPQTWDQLKAILPRMQARGQNFAFTYPIGPDSWWDVSMFMWQNGADAYTPDGLASAWDTPEGVRAFTDYVEFYTKYGVPKEVIPFQMFRNGNLAMAQGGLSFYTNLVYAAPEMAGRWDVGVVPGTPREDGRIDHTSVASAEGLSIFRQSRHQAQAWELMKFLVSLETQMLISERVMTEIPGTVLVPTHIEGWPALPIDERHKAQIFSEKANDLSPRYALVAPMNRRRFLTFAVSRVVEQGQSPEESIRIAAGEMNSELRRKQVEFARFIQRLN